MAKIIIELNTDAGDTLARVLASLSPPPIMPVVPGNFRTANLGPMPYSVFDPRRAPVQAATSTETAIAPVEGAVTVSTPVEQEMTTEQAEAHPHVEDQLVADLGPMDGERKRGESFPKGRRRTKEQIESDNRYFALHPGPSETQAPGPEVEIPPLQTTLSDPALLAAVSTGEPRVNPEDEAQDAADEAAESKANKSDKLTVDDLRQAVGRYTKAHGIAKAQKDVPLLLGKSLLEVPVEDIPDAIAKLDTAAATPEVKPEPKFMPVDTSKPVEIVEATIEDVKEAILAYAKKYDGVSDMKEQAKMLFTGQDIPATLSKVFGPNVKAPKQIDPPTPVNYGKALTAINEATSANPFKRTPK